MTTESVQVTNEVTSVTVVSPTVTTVQTSATTDIVQVGVSGPPGELPFRVTVSSTAPTSPTTGDIWVPLP